VTEELRVWVDHERCVGSSMCVTIAPGVFKLNDNRQSEVADLQAASEESILEAADCCPVSAIRVESAGGSTD
jgi:ferredoxin